MYHPNVAPSRPLQAVVAAESNAEASEKTLSASKRVSAQQCSERQDDASGLPVVKYSADGILSSPHVGSSGERRTAGDAIALPHYSARSPQIYKADSPPLGLTVKRLTAEDILLDETSKILRVLIAIVFAIYLAFALCLALVRSECVLGLAATLILAGLHLIGFLWLHKLLSSRSSPKFAREAHEQLFLCFEGHSIVTLFSIVMGVALILIWTLFAMGGIFSSGHGSRSELDGLWRNLRTHRQTGALGVCFTTAALLFDVAAYRAATRCTALLRDLHARKERLCTQASPLSIFTALKKRRKGPAPIRRLSADKYQNSRASPFVAVTVADARFSIADVNSPAESDDVRLPELSSALKAQEHVEWAPNS